MLWDRRRIIQIKTGHGTPGGTADVDSRHAAGIGLLVVKEEGWQKNKLEMFCRGTGVSCNGLDRTSACTAFINLPGNAGRRAFNA